MKVGDLVRLGCDEESTQLDMFTHSDLGIIVESHSYNKKSSGNEYSYFVVHWLSTGHRSTHGASLLVLITKEKNESWRSHKT